MRVHQQTSRSSLVVRWNNLLSALLNFYVFLHSLFDFFNIEFMAKKNQLINQFF
jgi:hypothetical protein